MFLVFLRMEFLNVSAATLRKNSFWMVPIAYANLDSLSIRTKSVKKFVEMGKFLKLNVTMEIQFQEMDAARLVFLKLALALYVITTSLQLFVRAKFS